MSKYSSKNIKDKTLVINIQNRNYICLIMDTKTHTILLFLMSLLGSSCANKNILVQDRVFTQYSSNTQKNDWNELEARKKIPMKSLRVLVIDWTNAEIDSPYKIPFSLRVHTEQPMHADTLIESRYYNHLTLEAFKQSLPSKAKVKILTRDVPTEIIDSLILADKYDVVLTAKYINFYYRYSFAGINESSNKQNKQGGITVGNTTYYQGDIPRPIRQAGTLNSSLAGSAFDFFAVEKRRPPLITNTIIYNTEWELQWITSADHRKKNEVTLLQQEGIIVDYNNQDDKLITSAAQQAGKSLAQVFNW